MKKLSTLTALAAVILAVPAMADAPKGYLTVPGTDTAIQIYGNVAADLVYDAVQGGGVMQGLSGAGTATDNSSPKGQFDMTMDESRFGMRTITPTSKGDIKTRIEWDFLGTNKDSDTKTKTPWNNAPWVHPISGESKNYLHLRQAYGEWNGWLFGKADNNFEDPDGSPNYIDWDGLLADWYGCGRDMQIRYTATFDDKNTLAVAIERNDGNTIGGNMPGLKPAEPAPDGTAYKGASHTLPGDLTARYTFSDKWGHIAVAAAYTKYEQFGILAAGGTRTVSKDVISWALSGHFQFGDDSLTYHFGLGAGQWGAFLQDGVAFDSNGVAQVVMAKQFESGYEHYWTPKVHSNLFVSYVGYSRDDNKGIDGSAFKSYIQYGANVMYDASRTVRYAIEFINGQAKTFDANTMTNADGSKTDSIGETKLHLQAKFKFN
jgi:hypothetical protein